MEITMITIEKLKAIGIRPEEGVARCMGDENMYLNLVGYIIKDDKFDTLQSAIDSGDLDTAFEAAHSLKGVLGNLSLNTLYDPMVEITELLRGRTETDYGPLLTTISTEFDKLKEQWES